MESLSSLAFSGFNAFAFFRGPSDGAENNTAGPGRADLGGRTHRSECAARQTAPRSVADTALNIEATAPSAAQPRSASALSFSHSDRTTLFITTQDGDTVRLKIKSSESMSASSAELETGDGLLTEVRLQTQSTTKISFTINGDLSAEELTAIRGVVEQASELAQDFFAGDLQSAFAAAADFNIDASQLASVGLRMSSRAQLTYSEIGMPRPSASLPTPPTSAPPPTTSTSVVADIPPPSTAGLTEAAPAPTPEASVPVAHTPADSTSQIGEVLGSIQNFLSTLINKLGTPAPTEASSVLHIDLSLKLKIFQSMLTVATTESSTSQESTLPALVPETLDTLAAQQTPALHATI
jgi:hypothetical protein